MLEKGRQQFWPEPRTSLILSVATRVSVYIEFR